LCRLIGEIKLTTAVALPSTSSWLVHEGEAGVSNQRRPGVGATTRTLNKIFCDRSEEEEQQMTKQWERHSLCDSDMVLVWSEIPDMPIEPRSR
jgi:hypothetical protein